MAWLWTFLWVDPLIILSTILCGAVSHAVSWFDAAGHRQVQIGKVWARSLVWIAGVKVEVEGASHIRPDTPYVFICNHLSYMDTPVLLSNLPVPFRFLAKESLFRIWFMGWHLERAGHIPVPMENPRAAIKTLAHAASAMRAHGVSLLIFPEGGRSEDGVMQEFKDGAAYLAIKAQAPLVPMALIGTRDILAMHSAIFHRGRVTLRIGTPICTEGRTTHQRAEIIQEARQQIVSMLQPRP